MDWLGITLGVIALICVCLPCRWDPAIRMKEYFEREKLDAKDGANRRNPNQTPR